MRIKISIFTFTLLLSSLSNCTIFDINDMDSKIITYIKNENKEKYNEITGGIIDQADLNGIYVSYARGNDSYEGDILYPVKTISHAFELVGGARTNIYVDSSSEYEEIIVATPETSATLTGGYDPTFTNYSITTLKTSFSSFNNLKIKNVIIEGNIGYFNSLSMKNVVFNGFVGHGSNILIDNSEAIIDLSYCSNAVITNSLISMTGTGSREVKIIKNSLSGMNISLFSSVIIKNCYIYNETSIVMHTCDTINIDNNNVENKNLNNLVVFDNVFGFTFNSNKIINNYMDALIMLSNSFGNINYNTVSSNLSRTYQYYTLVVSDDNSKVTVKKNSFICLSNINYAIVNYTKFIDFNRVTNFYIISNMFYMVTPYRKEYSVIHFSNYTANLDDLNEAYGNTIY
ncbi:MAG: hypothetical protein HPY53_01245 [Brevinematales bacterium]|nr:hypothetical protein [Brevinematales bacterium]